MNRLIFVVLAATFSWFQPSVEQRTREVRHALPVDEAECECALCEYELCKRKLNEAADIIASISDSFSTVSMVSVDLKNGKITTVYENGLTFEQRYNPSLKRKEKRQLPKYDGEEFQDGEKFQDGEEFQDKEYSAAGWFCYSKE